MKIFIFDIDGTLANTDHRMKYIKGSEKKDWKSFFAEAHKDKPFEHIKLINHMASRLGDFEDVQIAIITGRPANLHGDTVLWLKKHKIDFDVLHMRPTNERKPDFEVKRDIYNEFYKDKKKNIVCVFEDRLPVAKMWREEGIPVVLCGDEWINGSMPWTE